MLLLTSVGDIEVELWSKEAPKACRNFVQLCMEGAVVWSVGVAGVVGVVWCG